MFLGSLVEKKSPLFLHFPTLCRFILYVMIIFTISDHKNMDAQTEAHSSYMSGFVFTHTEKNGTFQRMNNIISFKLITSCVL